MSEAEIILEKLQPELGIEGYSVKNDKIIVYCEVKPSINLTGIRIGEQEFKIEYIENCGKSKA